MTMQPYFLLITVLLLISFSSCKKDIVESPFAPTKSLVKTIREDRVNNESDFFLYELIYDSSFENRIIRSITYYSSTKGYGVNYDYSEAGKLNLFFDGSSYGLYGKYEINYMGFITKDIFEEWEWIDYKYDTNGYLINIGTYGYSIIEFEVLDGNIMKQIHYDYLGGPVSKIYGYTYTTIDNVNNINTEYYDTQSLQPGITFYGKPSKKLVDFIDYWDPRESLPEKYKITFSYEFDSKDRVSKIIRNDRGDKQRFTYTYYE